MSSRTTFSFRAMLFVLGFAFGLPVGAVEQQTVKEDKSHVRTWNDFANDLVKLHKRQIQDRDIDKKTQVGGYANHPDFFVQEEYVDKKSGKLLSRLQWEKEKSENIHSIEVFVYDDQGRVLRDYSASYLPNYRNAPSQTLIFLHNYNDGVHAFRSFDASGELIFERCQGTFKGEEFDMRLDEDELDDARYEKREFNKGIMATPKYRHCFGDLDETADLYLQPN